MNELVSMKSPMTLLPFPGAPRQARRPVVLVLEGRGRPVARDWAVELSAALNAELIELELASLGGDTRGALDRPQRLAATLLELGPQLVVLPTTPGWPSESAAWLARACAVPCLVARSHQGRTGLLAATSLEDRLHPVLQEAARLAGALGRPLTVVHNASAEVVKAGRGAGAVERRLERVGVELGAEVVVTRAQDAVSGILAEARREDADLIVVGAPCSPPNTGPVGARIVGFSRRSVLIVPLAA